MPKGRLTVNLAPVDTKKEGPSFDLPIAMAMREAKRLALLVPLDNADEAAVVEGIDIYPVSNLRQAADFVDGRISLAPYRVDLEKVVESHLVYEEDFADVKGQPFDDAQDEAEHALRQVQDMPSVRWKWPWRGPQFNFHRAAGE